MKLVVRRYRRTEDEGRPDYSSTGTVTRVIEGETAKECMEFLRILRNTNDVLRYTPYEIVDVWD